MPPDLAAFVRAMQRAGGITQERLANNMNLSRPQLANALAGRFGLSRDAADRLRSTLADLPQPQSSFL
jgi:plasmid maintenance system antidote protein VapI